MITKLEWQEWKSHRITQRLIYLIEAGRVAATEELVQSRKTIGDFHRGAIASFNDIEDRITSGDGMYTIGDEE